MTPAQLKDEIQPKELLLLSKTNSANNLVRVTSEHSTQGIQPSPAQGGDLNQATHLAAYPLPLPCWAELNKVQRGCFFCGDKIA